MKRVRSLCSIVLLCVVAVPTLFAEERLDNGIELPDEWPPRPASFSREEPTVPPYLQDPPSVIPIDVGRQLFVDDFLIEKTTLSRIYHQPEFHPQSPVFKAEQPWEFHRARNIPFAAPFSGGVWHDPKDGLLKMWYMAGSGVFFAYATSNDGIHWNRPKLDVARYGDNTLKIEPIQRDSSTVWLDLEAKDPARRFKMMYFRAGLQMRLSSDGINWTDSLGAPGGSGDRSTFFYNPFREVWVYSIRGGAAGVGRCRFYGESKTFGEPTWKQLRDLPKWACADRLDRVKNVDFVDLLPDLYNLDATPYESLMLGLFTIHAKVSEGNRPKINYVTLGYSRDGFHWHRPDRRPFLDVSEDDEAWNYGNVQSVGGGCLVMKDKLYFYCSGRNSRKPVDDGSGGSTGLAVLRRDGFASLDAGQQEGVLTTRPVTFSGTHAFVNVEFKSEGQLRVELLDLENNVVQGFSRDNCVPVTTSGTRVRLKWHGQKDIAQLEKKPYRFRFHLQNGSLYSFWVSPNEFGASNGYVAAGGTGFPSNRDTLGSRQPASNHEK